MMKRKALYATVAGALLACSAGISSAAQELVCDRQPTSTSAASCHFQDVSARVGSSAGATHYIVEPAASERIVVREPSERVVVREPSERVIVREPSERVMVREPVTTGTPVEPVVMTYRADSPFPDPSPPAGEVQTRVYVPKEPLTMQSGPSVDDVLPD